MNDKKLNSSHACKTYHPHEFFKNPYPAHGARAQPVTDISGAVPGPQSSDAMFTVFRRGQFRSY